MNKTQIQKEIERQRELLRYYYLKDYFDYKNKQAFLLGREFGTSRVFIDDLIGEFNMELECDMLRKKYFGK